MVEKHPLCGSKYKIADSGIVTGKNKKVRMY